MPSLTPYLVKKLLSEGYEERTVPEAKSLEKSCDTLLTYSDGITFKMVLLVDRGSRGGRPFPLTASPLMDAGSDCLEKYSGNVSGNKFPIQVMVVEVGKGPASQEDKGRLGSLKSGLFSKVQLSAWALDTSTATVWTNSRWLAARIGFGRFLRKTMVEPRLADKELFKPPAALREDPGPPFLTYAMLAVFVGVFVLEQVYALDHDAGLWSAGIQTLVAMGGSSRDLLLDRGDWFRLFTCQFLHADPKHLLLNCVAFYFGGLVLETLLGPFWLLALFFVGGLGGSLLSVGWNEANMVSLGASGAIMGLMVVGYILSFRLPRGAAQMQVQYQLLGVLIPSLLPFAVAAGGKVDFSAHLGGALTGLLAGLAIRHSWARSEPTPRFAGLVRTIALLGFGVYLLGGVLAVKVYSHEKKALGMVIPNEWFQGKEELNLAQADELVAHYPHDPRSRYLRARILVKENRLVEAEKDLKAVVEDKELPLTGYKTEFVVSVKGTLAGVLIDLGKKEEALVLAREVCQEGPDTKMGKYMKEHGFCK